MTAQDTAMELPLRAEINRDIEIAGCVLNFDARGFQIAACERTAAAEAIVAACNRPAQPVERVSEVEAERDAALAEVEKVKGDDQRRRGFDQDTADLLMAINKDMHARNPMAVTAIDEWLAVRGIESRTDAALAAQRGSG